jgi:hypothetical protein
MVGFRVFDVGLLIVWLVWFFRLRDDDDRPDDDGPGGGGLGKPLGKLRQGGWRNRDHRVPQPRLRPRGAEPLVRPAPSRVRRPRTPVPAHRRTAGRSGR